MFTELDVSIAGSTAEDVDAVRVRIDAAADGERLAIQEYNGAGLPFLCVVEEQRIVVFNLPVGFDASVVLEELDGVEASLHLEVDAAGASVVEDWDITLRQTM